jgi:hypothetical protein
MALDPEIESILDPSIADPVLVSFSRLHCEERLILAISLGVFAIDKDTSRPCKRAAVIQVFPESGMTAGIPVIKYDGVVILGISIRYRDE